MSHKCFLVELTAEERVYLKQLVACGSPKTRPRRRAQIWLLCDQGPEGPAWTDERTAEAVAVTPMTVYRARQALVLEGMEAALQRKPRPPRPPKLDGTAQAELARLACSTPPPGRARWTLKLLAAELVALEVVDSIAPETVRRALKKTR
ncbi:MAG: helix-turn-helix domain-containing protein [Caldilineaceae bacterium]|nr:helix-turn-helix domain-containing protein [Caldilineaceae bacterium]